MNYGFVASKIDGTEYEFKVNNKMKMPTAYSYKANLPDVLNQGKDPICVPCSISAFINWNINVERNINNGEDHKVDLKSIYKSKTTPGNDGMTFKDAFKFLRNIGVKTDIGNYKIGSYFKIGSILQLKQAIVCNGPCFGALPVYNCNEWEFWDENKSSEYLGGHAIAIIGYNTKGFMIRNSWGKSWGEKGYTLLNYDDFNHFYELWSVV